MEVGKYTISLVSISTEQMDVLADGYYVTTVVEFEIEVRNTRMELIEDVTLTNIYGGPVAQLGSDRLDGDVHIHSTILEDLYIFAEWASDGSAMLHLRTLPMMVLVWTGLCMVCAGACARIFTFQR